MSSVVSCLGDIRRIKRHSVLLRFTDGRVGLHHRKADGMPLNFSGPGGESVVAPEGFMDDKGRLQRDTSYLLYEEERRHASYRATFKNMDANPFSLPMEIPRRLDRPTVERFLSAFLEHQQTIATFIWEFIIRTNGRLDQLEEQRHRAAPRAAIITEVTAPGQPGDSRPAVVADKRGNEASPQPDAFCI